METFLVVGVIILGLAILGFIVTSLAAFFILAGPPDAHDIDIQGTPKKKDRDV